MSTGKMSNHDRAVVACRARWGEVRKVRLTELSPPVRAAILALVEADKAARSKTPQAAEPPGSGQS